MARIAFGRATFWVTVSGWMLSQAAVGCGSASTPKGDNGGMGAESGAADEGGSSNADTGGARGDTGGSGGVEGGAPPESGAPGDSGGRAGAGGSAGAAGRAGAGGNTSGGVGGFSGFGNSTGTGASGFGGRLSGGSGGAPGGTGGKASGGFASGGMATGGTPGCVKGKPCKCDDLVGITECDGSEESCACLPKDQCETSPNTSCFEPCGGEPFGAWVLVDSCFGTGSVSSGSCQETIEAKPGTSDLRLRLLDYGDMQVYGTEEWTVAAQESLGCMGLSSVYSCPNATYWDESLLFSSASAFSCVANACGVCECGGKALGYLNNFFGFERWSRSGNNLRLGSLTTPYCVKGDELWIGGQEVGSDSPKPSYKFKKRSCTGTPLPCSARTAEQCAFGCSVGVCKATTGTLPRCATAFSEEDCGVVQGCTWDPDGCSGTAAESCQFENCGTEPGCTWGEPKARCGGTAISCEARDVNSCTGEGCEVRVCMANFSELGECPLLSATDCTKAPGCFVSTTTGACTGQTYCTNQTDAAICSKLGTCFAGANCAGTPTECQTLTVEACQNVDGCRIEW